MWLFYDNVVTFMVAAVACTFAWLFGGTIASYLTPVVPWLEALLLELMLCFPQRHRNETSGEARERVWHELKEDPLTWVVVGFFALLAIPFVNTGLCAVCDYAAIELEGANPAPAVPFLPYCVNRLHHMNVVMWFVPALTAMLAVKHALCKRGKRLLISLIVWNGVGLVALGIVQQVAGAPSPLWIESHGESAYFFSTFGYPNMGGDYFTTLFGLAVGLWRWNIEEIRAEKRQTGGNKALEAGHVKFWKKHYLLIPAALFFFAALATLSRAAIILVSLLALIFVAHSFRCFFARLPRARRVRAVAVSFIALVLIALCAIVFMPESLQNEVNTLDTTAVLDRVTGKGQYHARVATEIWKENLLFGCGGWGYKHLCIPRMTEQELRNIQITGGINVHNDHLQFLAEHGIVGYGCLVAMVVLLLRPMVGTLRKMAASVRFIPPKDQPPKPVSLFIVPAPVFCILLTAAATLIHGFGDCPLRSPAVLTLFFVSLASIDGFLPHLREAEEEDAHRHHRHHPHHH